MRDNFIPCARIEPFRCRRQWCLGAGILVRCVSCTCSDNISGALRTRVIGVDDFLDVIGREVSVDGLPIATTGHFFNRRDDKRRDCSVINMLAAKVRNLEPGAGHVNIEAHRPPGGLERLIRQFGDNPAANAFAIALLRVDKFFHSRRGHPRRGQGVLEGHVIGIGRRQHHAAPGVSPPRPKGACVLRARQPAHLLAEREALVHVKVLIGENTVPQTGIVWRSACVHIRELGNIVPGQFIGTGFLRLLRGLICHRLLGEGLLDVRDDAVLVRGRHIAVSDGLDRTRLVRRRVLDRGRRSGRYGAGGRRLRNRSLFRRGGFGRSRRRGEERSAGHRSGCGQRHLVIAASGSILPGRDRSPAEDVCRLGRSTPAVRSSLRLNGLRERVHIPALCGGHNTWQFR